MSCFGGKETEKLKENLEKQLERLVDQLNDLEKSKEELDTDEYKETKQETIEQLQELNHSLAKLIKGDITLVNELCEIQIETQNAISKAFKTFFIDEKNNAIQLREKLKFLNENGKLTKNSKYESEQIEILSTLRDLGEKLTTEELIFLQYSKHDKDNAFEGVEFEFAD